MGKYIVLSPDGIPISPDTYPTKKGAREALKKWMKRYEMQGYYSSNSGRISLADLESMCEIKRRDL